MKKLYSLLLGLAMSLMTFAVDFGPVGVSVSTDVVSHYLYRGTVLGGLSVQPCVEVSAYGFTAGAWGSVGMSPYWNYKNNVFSDSITFVPELDVYLSYTTPGDWVSISVTQFYYFDGSKYFNYAADTLNSTQTEIHAQVKLAPYYDIYFHWNTHVGGGDVYVDDNDVAHKYWSSYAAFTGSFELPHDITLDAEVGFSPYRSCYTYYNEDTGEYAKFAVNNISAACQKHWYAGGKEGDLVDMYVQAKVAFNLFDVGYQPFGYGKNFNWMVGFGFSL